MNEKSKEYEKLMNTVNQDLFVFKSVDAVNHKPHPFMVGPQHVKKAADERFGILDESVLRSVKCAHKGCQNSYDNHTYDTVAFLQLTRNASNDEAKSILQQIIDATGKIAEGFCFVETEEKFRIT